MSQIEFTPLNAGQIGQTNDVQTQNPVGNTNGKAVCENHPPVLADSTKLPRKTLIGNHGPLRRPTSGSSTRPTFASFRKSTTSTPATPQNQSVETPKTPRPSFASIKNTKPSEGKRGPAMIEKNRSTPQTQAQPKVTQQSSDSRTQIEQTTTEQTQSTSAAENANKTEEKT